MAENEKEEQEAGGAKKKSPMMLIIIIVMAALVIGGGGAVAFLMLKDKGDAGKDAQPPAEEVAPTTLGKIVKLESFVVNLSGSGGRNYLKIDISLELSSEAVEEEINNRMPQVKDAVLMLLSTRTYDDIKSSQGKLVLKEELLMRLNTYLQAGVIKNIYFTSFVVQ
ncbi:MAG: flagellar basal body protein FliL [Deltaproteobacteria bacterium]|nr:flagellar basal body protein FliL [Deltaproteobacteria bacterium]